jgi:hypothetical protein
MNNTTSRRQLLKKFGLTGIGLASMGPLASESNAAPLPASDIRFLNFALNLKYLEAEYYTYATTGAGIEALGVRVQGTGVPGAVTIKANPLVPFVSQAVLDYALEIAADERTHVKLLRSMIFGAGRRSPSRPAIDLTNGFTEAARAAGVVGPTDNFDPFADEVAFLIGAFMFEDLGVTAFRGVAPLVMNKGVLSAVAGLLGAEAYHAANIRTKIYEAGGIAVEAAQKVSDWRDALDGEGDRDQGVVLEEAANIVPTNAAGIVFGRSVRQVLNILYGTPDVSQGGFFPAGMNR